MDPVVVCLGIVGAAVLLGVVIAGTWIWIENRRLARWDAEYIAKQRAKDCAICAEEL